MRLFARTWAAIALLLVASCTTSYQTSAGSSVGAPIHKKASHGSYEFSKTSAIVDSEVGIFSKTFPEPADYGRYTYILLAMGQRLRNAVFLSDLFSATNAEGSTGIDPRRLNLFEVPVLPVNASQLITPATVATNNYDYATARRVLSLVCITPDAHYARICKSSRTVGPYLITYAHPLGRSMFIRMPYLVVNLSGIDKAAFPYFIDKMKEQVQSGQITDTERIYSFRGYLLSWLYGFTEIPEPLKRGILELVLPRGK